MSTKSTTGRPAFVRYIVGSDPGGHIVFLDFVSTRLPMGNIRKGRDVGAILNRPLPTNRERGDFAAGTGIEGDA
jgi:hypothetical protein